MIVIEYVYGLPELLRSFITAAHDVLRITHALDFSAEDSDSRQVGLR